MARATIGAALALVLAALHLTGSGAAVPRNGLVGWSIYRHLDQLPEIPTGVHEFEVSSYDRTGGNADGGPYACLHRASDGCVLAAHRGPGQIDSIWFTKDGGDVRATGNIRIVLDGRTVLNAPLQSVADGDLGAPFTYPLVANADLSSGGVYIQIPMPFRSSMRVITQHNPGYYHVFYRTFGTSRGVRTFNPSDRALDVLSMLGAAGYGDPKRPEHGARTTSTSFRIRPGHVRTLASLDGPGAISSLRLRIPQLIGPVLNLPNAGEGGLGNWTGIGSHGYRAREGPALTASADILRQVHLIISFDGHRTVDSPLGEFFGSGLGDFPVRALMFAVDGSENGWLSSWWPMPYRSRALVQLANLSSQAIVTGAASVVSAQSRAWSYQLSPAGQAGYFSTASHTGLTTPGQDWPFLQVRGGGKLVGISQTMDGPNRTFLEGDDIGYVDGARSPQIHGTGTEDFFEGGWYWNRGPFSDPLNGEPGREQGVFGCRAVCDSAYRLMLADSIPFSTSINYGIEHGNQNSVQAIYSTTAFWYQRPRW